MVMINEFPNGLTVKELKDIILKWEEVDSSGEDRYVWLQSGHHLSSPAKIVTSVGGDLYIGWE